MRVIGHIIGFGGHCERRKNTRLIHPDLKVDRFATVEKPVHMVVKKRPLTIIKTHPFPHAVPQKKSAVIDRHFGVIAVKKRSIYIDLNIAISDVLFGIMGGMGVIGCHHVADLK